MAKSITTSYLYYIFIVCICVFLMGYASYQLVVYEQMSATVDRKANHPSVSEHDLTNKQKTAPVANKYAARVKALPYFRQLPARLYTVQNFAYLMLLVTATLVILIMGVRFSLKTILYVRRDIKSLARLFKDVRQGAVRVDYPMELNEFRGIFQFLRDSGSRMHEEQKKFKKLGLIDHLSQLNNRRHFELKLKELFNMAKTNGHSSVLIIDLDNFKKVNDRYGHDAGDALITGFSEALRKVVRQTDVLARLGGDEFCVIYTYTDIVQSEKMVERLRRELPREITLSKGIVHVMRWTGGLSVMQDSDKRFDDVLWRADQALLQAKEAGRNNTKTYRPSPDSLKQIV